MSHSPLQAASGSPRDDYFRSWQGLVQLMRQGRSFSGRERHCCFLNTGRLPFANVSAVSGLDFPEDGRAVAATDWDRDGDVDVWLISRTAPRVRLLVNQQTGGRFIGFGLSAQTGNRDAIGAKVEITLPEGQGRLVKTVRAGDGFLTQSSKWLHFGLGKATEIEDVSVTWPDGTLQRLGPLKVDQHYQVAQGSSPQAWKRTEPAQAVAAGPMKLPEPGGTLRLAVGGQVPIPQLAGTDASGAPLPLQPADGRPLLMNVWGSWCGPCREELQALAAAGEKIQAAGLRIVAVNVDHLTREGQQSGADPQALLTSWKFPFQDGRATSELMGKLDLLRRPLVESDEPLPLPTSLLVRPDGTLAALYRGPVTPAQLLADVQTLMEPHQGVPPVAGFAGKWHSAPSFVSNLVRLGGLFRDAGHLQDAAKYGEAVLANDPQSRVGRMLLASVYLRQGKHAQAAELYRGVLADHPQDAEAHFGLGNLARDQGRLAEAEEHFRRAIELNPAYAEAHNNLGSLLAQQGQWKAARHHFQRALELDPQDEIARENLRRLQALE